MSDNVDKRFSFSVIAKSQCFRDRTDPRGEAGGPRRSAAGCAEKGHATLSNARTQGVQGSGVREILAGLFGVIAQWLEASPLPSIANITIGSFVAEMEGPK